MRVTKDDCQIWASTSSAELEVAADEYEAKGAEIPEIADIARRIRVELDRREALAPPRPYAPPFQPCAITKERPSCGARSAARVTTAARTGPSHFKSKESRC